MFTNPIYERRYQKFKANKRGFYSLIILCVLSLISLLSEFVSNDQPIVLKYNDHYYFPIFKVYTEDTFGGTLETATDYKDPLIKRNIEKNGWMLFTLIPYGPSSVNYQVASPVPSPPSKENWLGTDDQGRDVLARLLYGYRTSILFGIILAIFSSIGGLLIGAIQGYFGGYTDLFVQRIVEIWTGIPVLFVLIILSSLIEPTFWWLLWIMVLFQWPQLVSVVRAEFYRTSSLDYVRAAEVLGLSHLRIMAKHILPNALVATFTYLPFIVSGSISVLVSLDFLGFGLPPGSASLGELLLQGKNNIQCPWLGFSSFFAMALLLSLLIFIGEGVKDSFDPRSN